MSDSCNVPGLPWGADHLFPGLRPALVHGLRLLFAERMSKVRGQESSEGPEESLEMVPYFCRLLAKTFTRGEKSANKILVPCIPPLIFDPY